MTVRAKFQCQSILQQPGSRPKPGSPIDPQRGPNEFEPCVQYSVTMAPVYGGYDGENFKFWSATPSGKLEMNIMNQDAASQFEVGKHYYLDFTPAE